MENEAVGCETCFSYGKATVAESRGNKLGARRIIQLIRALDDMRFIAGRPYAVRADPSMKSPATERLRDKIIEKVARSDPMEHGELRATKGPVVRDPRSRKERKKARMQQITTMPMPHRRGRGRRGHATPLPLLPAQGEDYYKVLSPDSVPRVRLYSEAEMRQVLDEPGLLDPRLLR